MSKTQARAPHCSLNHLTMFLYLYVFAAVMLVNTPMTGHHCVLGPVRPTVEICDLIRSEQTDVES